MSEPGGVGTPGTEAGRQLYAQFALLLSNEQQLSADRVPLATRLVLLGRILAIEAEAARSERERIVRAVEETDLDVSLAFVSRSALLAILRDEP